MLPPLVFQLRLVGVHLAGLVSFQLLDLSADDFVGFLYFFLRLGDAHKFCLFVLFFQQYLCVFLPQLLHLLPNMRELSR
jgi:hypothetical protein